MTHNSVELQIDPASVPALPSWFGEVAMVAQLFTTSGVLQAIEERPTGCATRFNSSVIWPENTLHGSFAFMKAGVLLILARKRCER